MDKNSSPTLRPNKALLKQEEVAKLEEWERFFTSPGWKMYQEFFAQRYANVRMNLLDAVGLQELGYLQGAAQELTVLLANAEPIIMGEFFALTKEFDTPEAPDPVTGPKSWDA